MCGSRCTQDGYGVAPARVAHGPAPTARVVYGPVPTARGECLSTPRGVDVSSNLAVLMSLPRGVQHRNQQNQQNPKDVLPAARNLSFSESRVRETVDSGGVRGVYYCRGVLPGPVPAALCRAKALPGQV